MSKNNNPWEDDEPWKEKESKQTQKIENFKEFIKSQSPKPKLNTPNNNNNLGLKIKWGIIALLIVWGLSGFYQVAPNELGVVLQFGKYKETTEAGLHYRLPSPIETIIKVDQSQERSFTLGTRKSNRYDEFTESHMLTGDENIVDINLTIVWRVKDAKNYLFSVREPEVTVYDAAQSVLREVVGQAKMEAIITEDRGKVQDDTKDELQGLLDDFDSGIQIVRVRLQKADPPQQVVDAYNEVQRARADQEKFKNEAEAYRNAIIPSAHGEASKIKNEAQAYKEGIINKATGEMGRYKSVYNAYKQGKAVTAKKLYLETMEDVIGKSNTVIIDPSTKGGNMLPMLPIGKTK